ncbi:MAG: aspartate--tRNA ligase [Clostridia bacterium]|nr:aspartate--tRNA ligase [Clostridia bacterium]
MAESMHAKRTDRCGNLRREDVGRTVTLCGWVAKRRNLGSLLFIDLRDVSGVAQITFDDTVDKGLFDKANGVRSEYCLCVTGKVRERGTDENKKMATGAIEVLAERLSILSKSETPPFEITGDCNAGEELRLKYRYLDLRRTEIKDCLVLRHKVCKIARDYYDANGFLEIETPMLCKSTPEGARDYLVPSRLHHGSFYALPQSPQLYKQLLMVAGYDRYMQIARCFRDEDLRADRQPEFTQIDLEMSFVDVDDVITVNEGFLKKVFKEVLSVDLKLPLPRMPYREAMDRFGSDKPDLRFGFEIKDITEIAAASDFKVFRDAVEQGGTVRGININGFADKISRKEIDSLTEFAKTYRAKGVAWLKFQGGEISGSFAKFITDEEKLKIASVFGAGGNDLILIVADKPKTVFASLGALRCEIAKRLGVIKKDDYKLLWITEFPLFEYSEEEERYVAMHHPFTSPMDEDKDMIESAPDKVRAKAYDIVFNGVEAGGGSIRIHDADLQERMFRAIGISEREARVKFGYLLDAFTYGVPPHGGMAYGLDRLIMLLADTQSIRDVIAFPKVQNASELMTESPSEVPEKSLLELGIKLADEK